MIRGLVSPGLRTGEIPGRGDTADCGLIVDTD